MSDILIGVIIGGVIASIAPITTLILNHMRWKRESKLEYLKTERRRLEETYDQTLDKFAKAVIENSYPSKMTSEIMILMPKNVSEKFMSFMTDKEKTKLKCKNAYMDLAVAMKQSLKEIDKKIQELVE